jgi:hypothetical protein
MAFGAARQLRLGAQGVEVGEALGPIGQRHHQLGQAHARVMTAPRRSATSPSHTSPPRDTRPSPSPVTVRGPTSLVAFPSESPPELGC